MSRKLEEALPNDALAYAVCFVPKVSMYGPAAAQACIKAFREVNFTGRVEFYVREIFHPLLYIVGLGIKNAEGDLQPSYEWWKTFLASVTKEADPAEIEVDLDSSEMGDLEGVRETSISRGVVAFLDGMPHWVDETEDSWFIGECRTIIAREAQRM